MILIVNDLNEIGSYCKIIIENEFDNKQIKNIIIYTFNGKDELLNYQTYDLNKFKNAIKFLEENGNN